MREVEGGSRSGSGLMYRLMQKIIYVLLNKFESLLTL